MLNIKDTLLKMGEPVEKLRDKISEYPLSWRVGVAFFLILTIISAIPVAFEQMEYYQLYQLHEQDVKDLNVGTRTYDGVLVMELSPYAYPDGERSIRKIKDPLGNIKELDTDGMEPATVIYPIVKEEAGTLYVAAPNVTLYFAEEHKTRADLERGELVVVRWVWGLGGYHVKGIAPLDEYQNHI